MTACALMAALFAVALPTTSRISGYAARTKSLSNMRQIGVAAGLYANDHDQQLPGPADSKALDSAGAASAQQWPALLCSYLSPSNPVVFLDPGDPTASSLSVQDILSNTKNNTGYLYNGFDELAVNSQPPATIHLNRLFHQSDVILLAQKKPGATAFCLSPIFQPVANLLDLLAPGAYEGGSHYLFVDGSVRYVKWEDYSNDLWLVNKGATLPLPPLPPIQDTVSAGYAQTMGVNLPLATVP